jgi:hypothetical protein
MAGSPLSKLVVSEIPDAWFHCCHCGQLFKASPKPGERGLCTACGHDPVTGEPGLPAGDPAGGTRVRRRVRKHAPAAPHHGKRSRHGRKKARALMYFVAAWVGLVALIALFFKRIPDAAPTPSPDYVEKTDQLSVTDLQLLQDHLQECGDHFLAFLNATDPAERSQHVIRSEEAIPRMSRYYELNPAVPSPGAVSLELQNVIHTPAGRGIETTWKREDGDLLEAVFFEDEGEWKLDWDAHVRACSEPWALFLAAQGPGEGEFRVLARERIGAGGRNDESIGMVLYQPRPGHPDEAVSPSPEVRVLRGSALGRAIEEAFVAREQNIGVFGSKAFANDPDGMIRLRLKLSRGGDDTRVFEVEELLATHWLEIPETPIKAGE